MNQKSVPYLQMMCFGQPRLVRPDGTLVMLRSRKHLALLIYLAIEQRYGSSRDSLLALLWPDGDEDAARNNLRVALADLRHALGEPDPPLLITTRTSVQFNSQSAHSLDILTFRELLAASSMHRHESLATCAACLSQLEQAVALYSAAFLDGFMLPDSAQFEEWALIQREQLLQAMLEILSDLANAYEQRNEHLAQCRFARRQLELEPWREQAHAQLMRGLWASGQRGAALEQFHTCQRILKTELGLDPSPELTDLYQHFRSEASREASVHRPVALSPERTPIHMRLSSQEVSGNSNQALSQSSLDAPGNSVIQRQAQQAGFTNNLPTPLTACVGRESDLRELLALATSPEIRLLTLVGVGGIGKTLLAIALGRARLAEFANGVCFVSLAPLSSAASIASAILNALGDVAFGDSHQALLQALQGKHLLLILDNFEHLMEGVSIITNILHSAPQIEVLVTSRERLNLRGEHPYFVQGLAYPTAATLSEAADTAAVQVFVQYARRVQRSFDLNNSNIAAVLRICQVVDGMPLGLELAAAMVELLSANEIASEIAQSIDVLTATWGDLPERQRSLRAVCEWSWRSLSAAEQQSFQQLAFFRGGFTRQAATAIAGATLPVLMRFIDKALLRAQPAQTGNWRYDLHELLRQFALEQLSEAPAVHTALAARHGAFYLALAEERGTADAGAQYEAWLELMEQEHDNIRAALAWAAEHRDATFGMRLAGAIWPFWQRCSYLIEGLQWLEMFLAIDRNAEVAPHIRATTLHAAGWLAHDQDDFVRADAYFAEGLHLNQQLGQHDHVATVLAHRGIMARSLGQYAHASALLTEGLALARANHDLTSVAYCLFRLGVVTRERGEYAQAIAIYQECTQAYQMLNDRIGIGFALLGYADIARDQGHAAAIRAPCSEATGIGRELGQRWISGFALNNLALAALMERRLDDAEQQAAEALALFQAHGIRGGVVELQITSGQIALARGAIVKAKQYLLAGVRGGWPNGPHWLVATGLEELAAVFSAQGDPTRAARLYAAAARWRAAMGAPLQPYRRAAVETSLSQLRGALGQTDFAAHWEEGALLTPAQAVALVL